MAELSRRKAIPFAERRCLEIRKLSQKNFPVQYNDVYTKQVFHPEDLGLHGSKLLEV